MIRIQNLIQKISSSALVVAAVATIGLVSSSGAFAAPPSKGDTATSNKTYFVGTCEVSLAYNDNADDCVINFPADKRFVIESVSASLTANAGEQVGAFLTVNTGGTSAKHRIPLSAVVFQNAYGDRYESAFATKIYAEERQVAFLAYRNGTGSPTSTNIITLSGYLEPK